MFEAEDAEAIIDVTKNFVGSSNSKTTVTTFPNSMPTFTLNTEPQDGQTLMFPP